MSSFRILLACFVVLLVASSCTSDEKKAPNAKVDRIVLKKSERELILMSGNAVVKSYKVALGKNPVGHKKQEGDNRTPEGRYVIDRHNPNSAFHLSLHISYPSASDRDRAQRDGVRPGGDIMIHGLKNGMGWIGPLHRLMDWTQGCVAVTNEEIEEIYSLVADGTPIEIEA